VAKPTPPAPDPEFTTITLTIRKGGHYGAITREGGESFPARFARPNEHSVLITFVPPSHPNLWEALDRTWILAAGDAKDADAALAREEADAAAADTTEDDDTTHDQAVAVAAAALTTGATDA
jgi:hypothetical protein